MSAGMPTVTTTDGAAGLDLTDGEQVLIGDSPQAFADAVVRILADEPLRRRMRAAGHAYLAEHHSAEQLRHRLTASLQPGARS
jgi:glycosyltransferase involved in cell wall biosynthesis